jgi:cysteinyl-tRNA synthetase
VGLYFDTSNYRLRQTNRQDLSQIKAGARIEMSEEKKNPTDFSVWKFSPTDKQRDMEWASPWGKGFPGWHLECSVISTKYLGQPFDLHTGGIEHIPIHHTNEIAQSEAAYDKPLANYWVHFEHLLLGQNKMAKSSGQALTLESLHEQGYEPLVFRYFVLQTHYSKKQEFSWEALAAARSGYNNLKNRLLTLPSRGKVVPQYKEKFIEAINNDFNIAQGLAVAWDLLKDEAIAAADKKATWLDFDRVFGLGLKNLQATPIPPEIAKLAEERWSAKQTQDWEKADKLRQKIDQCGYIIDDTKDHYTITKK